MPITVGDAAPAFELYDQDRNLVGLESLRGHKSLVVFIPSPFTGVCDAESCTIRDGLGALSRVGAKVVIITTHAISTNKPWVERHGFTFPVLSDYWPHGEVSKAFGAFNERFGIANRVTFVLDSQARVREIVASDSFRTGREFNLYTEALAAL